MFTTKKIIIAVSTVATVALTLGSLSLTAFADITVANVAAVGAGISGGVNVSASASTTKRGTRGDGSGIDVTNVKDRDDQAIDQRVTALNDLITRLNQMVKVSSQTKASLSSEVQAETTNLDDLKTKIDADATDTLKTDSLSITQSFRIYALIIPQGRITALADRVDTIVGMLTTIGTKLQTRITADQTAGANVSAMVTLMTDYNSKIADANTQASAAVSEVSALTPDQGNQTIATSNHAALVDARAKLKTATTDLQTARKDAGTIITDLKAINVTTTSTTTVSASTTP